MSSNSNQPAGHPNWPRLGCLSPGVSVRNTSRPIPCDKIQRVRVVTPDPEILTNDPCRALVAAAKRSELGLLTYLGLALFCGIRSHEARQLTFEDIDMKQGIVALSVEKAKVRNRRIIDLTEPAKRCITGQGRRCPREWTFAGALINYGRKQGLSIGLMMLFERRVPHIFTICMAATRQWSSSGTRLRLCSGITGSWCPRRSLRSGWGFKSTYGLSGGPAPWHTKFLFF